MFIVKKNDARVYKIKQKNNYKRANVNTYLPHIFIILRITSYILNQESFRSFERIMFRTSNYLAALSFSSIRVKIKTISRYKILLMEHMLLVFVSIYGFCYNMGRQIIFIQ